MWNSPGILNAVSNGGLWIAAIFGVLAAFSGFVGGLAANRLSNITKIEAEAKISEANARATEAHKEAIQLKDGLAWRELSIEQRQILLGQLKGWSFEVYEAFDVSNPEVANFRSQIDAVLKISGLKPHFFNGQRAVGISILGEPTKERDVLSRALTEAGIEHRVGPPQTVFGKDHPALIIGTKPSRL